MHPFLYLERSAKANPTAIAISSPETELSYGELLDSAVRFAKVFREIGVKPGDKVGTLLPPLIDVVVSEALFHEATVGAQIPSGHPDVVAKVFDWVVVSEPIAGFAANRQILLDNSFMQKLARVVAVANPQPYANDDALCRLSFSSGTTGAPKTIPVSIDCLEDRAIERRAQWMHGQPYLCLLGLSTGLTFMSFYAHIKHGETFILAGSRSQVLDQIQQHKVECVMASPHQLGNLLADALATNERFESLKTVMSAGSVLPDAMVTGLQNRFNVKVEATYASTEAGSVAIREGVGAIDGLAGTLLDDVDVKIVDDEFRELPAGEVGRIAIRRARQPQTYLDDPLATAESFHDGYFYPGDLGFLNGRELHLAGRSTEIFNAAGVKVDPARVEAVAREVAGISDAAAFGLTDATGLTRIVLVFVSAEPIDVAALSAHMQLRLDESAPSKFARVAAIARNHMGKVNRQQVAAEFGPLFNS